MDLARTDDGMTLVSRLDFQRDPLSPVSRLPVEILADIFIYTAHNSYKTHASHPKPATPSWVNVSYVCRHWRDIALHCQVLWTYIPTTSQRWTQELLARSQKRPLKIHIQPNFHNDHCVHVLSIVKQLMNHSQRIQELHLDFFHATQECSNQALFIFWTSHLPCLDHLEISNLDFRRLEGESSSPFEGHTPALRTLMLDTCRIPWTSLELSALTTLHLRSAELPFPFPKITTTSEFLAVLRRMPHLVHLSISTLSSAHGFLSSGEINAAPIINLSHLSNMSIEAPISMINTLLSCVDIPLTTKVELECKISNESTAWGDITRLASLLAQRINPSSHPTPAVAPSFRSLTINGTLETAVLNFNMSERVSSSMYSHQFDENTRLLVYINSSVDIASSRFSAISSHMCRSMMPLSIRSVHFVGSTTTHPLLNFWRDMLASFPNVRHIKLSRNYMPQIASMLSLPSHDCSGDKDGPVDGGRNEIFVPALEELELYRITFSTVGSDLNSLCEAISTRKGTQCKLAIKKSRMITGGAYEALELVGCWEDNQFKVTRL